MDFCLPHISVLSPDLFRNENTITSGDFHRSADRKSFYYTNTLLSILVYLIDFNGIST